MADKQLRIIAWMLFLKIFLPVFFCNHGPLLTSELARIYHRWTPTVQFAAGNPDLYFASSSAAASRG